MKIRPVAYIIFPGISQICRIWANPGRLKKNRPAGNFWENAPPFKMTYELIWYLAGRRRAAGSRGDLLSPATYQLVHSVRHYLVKGTKPMWRRQRAITTNDQHDARQTAEEPCSPPYWVGHRCPSETAKRSAMRPVKRDEVAKMAIQITTCSHAAADRAGGVDAGGEE